jgi:hypothetical protein
MSPSRFQIIRTIRYIVTHFIATRAGTRARAIIVGAAAELVGQAQRLLAGQAVRCIFIPFTFAAVLMFLRANAAFASSVLELRPATTLNTPRFRDALVRVTSTSVEVLLLSLATFWLEQAVSLCLFVFHLESLLTTCHVAGHFDSPQFAPLSEMAATRARWGQ